MRARLRPYVEKGTEGPVEVADLFLEDRTALRGVPFAYFALGRVPSGKQQWEKAIASDSAIDNAVSHSNLGEELFKASASNDALPHLRRAYELDPQNTTFRMEYDAVRQRLGH